MMTSNIQLISSYVLSHVEAMNFELDSSYEPLYGYLIFKKKKEKERKVMKV